MRTIDKYVESYRIEKGENRLVGLSKVTSIKSVDIEKCYKTENLLYSKLKKDIDQLAKFKGTLFNNDTYVLCNDAEKILEVVVPSSPIGNRKSTFEKARKYAESNWDNIFNGGCTSLC